MQISNLKVYNYDEAVIASGFPARVSGEEKVTSKSEDRLKRLGKAPASSGHDCALKGVLVTFDLTCSQNMHRQILRYHFLDVVSSQSLMYKAVELDLDKVCNMHVDKRVISIVKEKINFYNEYIMQQGYNNSIAEEMKLGILYSLPMGVELKMSITTNVLQLKTMYNQRFEHELDEWKDFCEFMKHAIPILKEVV